jgi:hypothetical protein
MPACGKTGGTIQIKSGLPFPQWAEAVTRNMRKRSYAKRQDDVVESCHAQKSSTAENHEGQDEDEQRNHGADSKQM